MSATSKSDAPARTVPKPARPPSPSREKPAKALPGEKALFREASFESPPLQREGRAAPSGPAAVEAAPARPLGFVTTLLVVLTAVPAAVAVVPNTISFVMPQAMADLGIASADAAALVRAGGLALPALLLALPLASVAARRYSPWAVLLTGLACVVAGEAAASMATSVTMVSAVRLAEGVGAGLILPSSLVLVWARRSRTLAALWGGTLMASLMGAMPFALLLLPDDGAGDWRVVLHQYPALAASALVAAAAHRIAGLGGRHPGLPALRHCERTQLLLPAVPAAGFAFLAVVTTYGWSSGAQLLVAGVGLAGLTGLAVVGSRDAVTGSQLGHPVTVIISGLLAVPVVAPLAGLLSASAGTGELPLLPFAAGAGCAVVAALVVAIAGTEAARGLVFAGHGLSMVAVLLFLTAGPESDPLMLIAPLCALGGGTSLSLTASLRGAHASSALFGLAVCFPAVLIGHLIVGSLQIAKVNAVARAGGGAQETLLELTSAFREWLIVAGVLVVLLAAVTGLVSRRSTAVSDSR